MLFFEIVGTLTYWLNKLSSNNKHTKSSTIRIQIVRSHIKGQSKRKRTHKKRLLRWKSGLSYIPGTNKRSSSHLKSFRRIKVPDNFSFINNVEDCLKLYKRLQENLAHHKRTFIDLTSVTSITNDAIIFMLSIVSTFHHKKININGNFPLNKEIKDIFIQSGFFDYIGGAKVKKSENTKNKILTEKYTVVRSDITSDLVSDAIETVFGVRGRSPGIQRALIELMGNTFDHASYREERKEYWWLSVMHDLEKKKVYFAFIDNGLGILETIKQKPVNSLLTRLGIRSSDKILHETMTGELGSRYKLKNRGKGLPSFITSRDREWFGNLVVISNDAIGHISQNKYLPLTYNFKGTLFYWEFNNNYKYLYG